LNGEKPGGSNRRVFHHAPVAPVIAFCKFEPQSAGYGMIGRMSEATYGFFRMREVRTHFTWLVAGWLKP
jgi:hypothetical protein